jgi:SulP family sulfate permease
VWHEVPEVLKLPKLEVGVWLTTLSLTVFADLTVAVEAGMVLAALVFIRKVTETTTVSMVTEEDVARDQVHVLQGKLIPDYAAVFRIHGPFLFGSTEKLDAIREQLPTLPPVIVIRLRNTTAIDSTGLQALERLADEVRASGRGLVFCGARQQPGKMMQQTEFLAHVGRENICANIGEGIARAQVIFEEMAAADNLMKSI